MFQLLFCVTVRYFGVAAPLILSPSSFFMNFFPPIVFSQR